MGKIRIVICENFYPEYQEVLQNQGFEDIELLIFPSSCDQKERKLEVRKILEKVNYKSSVLICSKSCDAVKLLPEKNDIRTITWNYCFSHLTSEEFLNHLISEGSYIISSGWLKNWQRHINNMGFDEEGAREFFRESCKQLVLIDYKNDDKNKQWLENLSRYVDLPYLIIPVKLQKLELMIKSILSEWRLNHQEKGLQSTIAELRNQCAEYATIFDLLSKISTYSKKRDVINQIENIFKMIFGAEKFVFWNDQKNSIPEEIKKLQTSKENYLLLREDNRFCIKISWGNIIYGIIDVSEFLFPNYIEKYLNLSMEISKISGLVFHNNEQYEKILDSEKKLKYMSYHDAMTGLYNRNYINENISATIPQSDICVFMFDIDKLKYVNDHFGHAKGDRLIMRFARILEKSFRETDIVARIGGDEFVAFMYDSDEDSAELVKERIIKSLRINNKNIMDKGLELSASMGYVRPNKEDDTIEDLIRKADALMYKNKNEKS